MKHIHVILWNRQSNPSMIYKIWPFAVNRRRDYWRVTFVWAGFYGPNLGLGSTVQYGICSLVGPELEHKLPTTSLLTNSSSAYLLWPPVGATQRPLGLRASNRVMGSYQEEETTGRQGIICSQGIALPADKAIDPFAY